MNELYFFWTETDNLPFTVSLVLLVLLLVIQLAGLGEVESDFDADLDGPLSGLLSIGGMGRLPFLMWLALFLAIFGLIGLSGQKLMADLTGHLLTVWLAGPLAALVTFPLTGALARPMARILPRDETTAIPVEMLIGLEGRIVIGRASRGNPARARVQDFHGQDHYVMVEPDNDGQSFLEGQTVRIVRREGEIFRAIGDGATLLPRLDD